MKRTIVLLLAAILCLCFAACNKAAGQENGLQLSQMETTQVPPENSTEASEETVENPVPQDIELVGPWHLDSEKNDLAAFADSLELFPGYGEWGASMEIRSNGQMSWYIGAAGGCGTYTLEDDVLHGSLVDNIDQKDMAMDLRILVENEKAVLEMDYQDMTIYWVYGGQEGAPTIGNDKNQDDVAYPGADVAEIVNPRGDKTTVYKLADGTYMDREERPFTYNGTDTWTDENGTEWNEVAKD